MASPHRIFLGMITGAHGMHGAVRVRSFTAEPEDVASYGPLSDEAGTRSFALSVSRRTRGGIIARLAGIEDRDAAEALKGTGLYADRDALPELDEDEFYHADLVGLAVVLTDGRPLGRVRGLDNFGAGEVIEVETKEGKSLSLPFTRAAVPQIDLKAGRLTVDPPPGIVGDDGMEEG